jgi:hypothetical protein
MGDVFMGFKVWSACGPYTCPVAELLAEWLCVMGGT